MNKDQTVTTPPGEPENLPVSLVGFVLTLIVDIILLIVKVDYYILEGIFRAIFPPEEADVRDEVVLVTGSAHGMGREMAVRYGKLGSKVVCCDVNEKGNQDVVDEIKANGGRAFDYQCDLRNRDAILEFVQKLKTEVGTVTILVNNAGIMPARPLGQQTEAEIKSTFDLNVLANLWLIQAFLPDMKKNNHGSIVAMSSCAGLFGLKNLVPYCGTKFAVRGIMQALYAELRQDPNCQIKLTTIYPYMVDTGLCKNPRIRFPKLFKMVKPDEAAEAIISAQRRGIEEISIPRRFIRIDKLFKLLPKKAVQAIGDFIDCGVESD